MSEPEICICAAIRLPDGRVIRGHRHDGCIQYAKAMVDYEARPSNGGEGERSPVVDYSLSVLLDKVNKSGGYR